MKQKGKGEAKGTPNPETEQETPFQRFERVTRKVVSVPKSEVERRDAEWRKQKSKGKQP